MSHPLEVEGQPVMQDVLVCYALPERAWIKTVRACHSVTVREIVLQSGFISEHPNLPLESLTFGVFGKKVSPDALVGHGDRIEIYRPLTFDPKESRRRRAAHRTAKQKRQAQQNRIARLSATQNESQ
jgi:putative ubiquitin-RnfH superfamily antitoxin RatB of RatAB toxin-antitoxin module